MRLALILSGLVLLLVPSAQAGQRQTGEQEHKKVKTQNCKGAKKAIVFYRRSTWNMQDQLETARSVTRHPERWVKGCAYLNWIAKRWQKGSRQLFKTLEHLHDPKTAICHVFQRYCTQALAVSECESGKSTHAHNGQYRGLFQMGSSERRIFGHGSTAIEQARAAKRYFDRSGRDWSPWSCKPY